MHKTKRPKDRPILWVFLLAVLFTACRKLVEIPLPKDQVTTTTAFTDDSTASAAVMGLYSQMMRTNPNLNLTNGGMSVYTALSADEFYNTGPDPDLDMFSGNALEATNVSVLSDKLWLTGYTHIYHANGIISALEGASKLNPDNRRQLLGEVKTIRALLYFYLTNLFGDVPLVLSTDYRENATLARTPASLVYQQIASDLQEARQLLLPAYPSTGRVRVNKWAATALLARVELFRQRWAEADSLTTLVIQSGIYNLESNLNAVFTPVSKEAIWQLMPVSSSRNTAEGFAFIPSSASVRPAYSLALQLLNAFETGDQRKTSWIKTATVSSQAYHYPYKYKVRTTPGGSEYNMVLRLAEFYLIRAEARAQLNRITEAEEDLNRVRNRAGLGAVGGLDKNMLLAAIEKERQTELFAEWGHRWLDLKRTGRIDSVLEMHKQGWDPTDALYPIPLIELQRNPELIQNPGY